MQSDFPKYSAHSLRRNFHECHTWAQWPSKQRQKGHLYCIKNRTKRRVSPHHPFPISKDGKPAGSVPARLSSRENPQVWLTGLPGRPDSPTACWTHPPVDSRQASAWVTGERTVLGKKPSVCPQPAQSSHLLNSPRSSNALTYFWEDKSHQKPGT